MMSMEASRLPLTGAPVDTPLDVMRAGMPSLDTVRETFALTPSPGGQTYHVLRTIELDSYEPEASALAELVGHKVALAPATLAEALKPAPAGDQFMGTARKAAKLSIAKAATEAFADVRDLIRSLTPDKQMIAHKPKIGEAATSQRVKEEQRNVRVTAFLYAASHENDNDFHLIVGRKPTDLPEMYMTMEVSGLPSSGSAAFQKLKAARDAFKAFFSAHLPPATYDFYHPPIPVVVEGSLFFDVTHSIGQHPGPPSLKSRMPTIWEVHPVTSITLGP